MPRTQNTVTVMEDSSWERMWSSEVHKLLRYLGPWAVLGLLFTAGWATHRAWGRMPDVPWASVGIVLSGTFLASYTWVASRLAPVGRGHSAVTVAAAGLWLTAATITGPAAPATGYMAAVFGGTFALTWDIRGHVRRRVPEAGPAGAAGRLSAWFADAAKEAGIPGARLQVRAVEDTRVQAKAILPPGERTAADLMSKARHIESGLQFPPGSLSIAEDEDRADHALVTLSDPRLIRKPVPWPGPSLPGVSIAHPLRPGIWQDGVPVQHSLPGHSLHIMGSAGAGKSEGAGWSYCGDIITRPDAVIVAADLTKGTQMWGPLEDALHRVEYTRDGVRDMMNRLHKLIPERTTFLADHGLTKWTENCELSYLIVWLEETPDVYDKLTPKEQENFIADVRTIRSSGGSIVVSLQRSTFDQLPTIVRGQMASACFGLLRASDERYGLSEKQQEMGCSPSSWGIDHPGMAYLHYPGTPPERIGMPMRYYAWGDVTSKEAHDATAAAAMAAHAARYPAALRPADPLTASLTGGASTVSTPPARPGEETSRAVAVITRPAPAADDEDQDEEEEISVLDEHLVTEDPTPELEADIDDPIESHEDDEPFEFDTAPKMEPAAARQVFAEHLEQLRASGVTVIKARDLRPVISRTGLGRGWIHARLNEAVDAGQLEHDRHEGTYQFPAAA